MPLPASLEHHRVQTASHTDVMQGRVRYAPVKSLWFIGMALAAIVGGAFTFSLAAVGMFLLATALVLLLGHSLGSHRKLIHDSFACPRWLEYTLVWFGVQVGLSGPLGLMRQHELRDYAQRMPDCHPYLRHGRGFWTDAWWQLHCELQLDAPPAICIEGRVADNRFYRWLERTWMLQQLPPALLLYAWGGWAFVFWGTCARVTAGVLGHWLIGWFAHNEGGMHYAVQGAAVQGRNIRFTALLTMGECWHNNHHAYPGSARLGLHAGEWDPGWWMLMLLRQLGVVSHLRLPTAMAARPELTSVDAAADQVHWCAPAACGWRGVMATCLHLRRGSQFTLEGPAAWLSAPAMRRLFGRFDANARTRRITLSHEGRALQGLPALCAALCARGAVTKPFGLLLAPAAIAFEGLRERLDATA